MNESELHNFQKEVYSAWKDGFNEDRKKQKEQQPAEQPQERRYSLEELSTLQDKYFDSKYSCQSFAQIERIVIQDYLQREYTWLRSQEQEGKIDELLKDKP